MDLESSLPPELAAALERLDELIGAFEEHPDTSVQNRVVELLQCIDLVHRTGLRRLAQLLWNSGLEQPALNAPEVRLLLQLYDLAEGGDRARAEAVLDSIRPAVQSHGAQLELLEAGRGIVKVRLSGTSSGCDNSTATLRNSIEQILRDRLPDFAALEVVQAEPTPTGFVPIASLKQIKS